MDNAQSALKSPDRELELENQRLQKALAESEERLQLISRATNDTLWDWDLSTQHIWWNEGLHQMFGYHPEKAFGMDEWVQAIHPQDRDRIMEGLYRVIDHGGHRWSDEYRFQKADGSYAYVLDRAYVLHTEEGKPHRMLGSMVDLTRRKQMEEELRESQARLQTMFDQTIVGIALTDREGHFLHANDFYCGMVGRSREELLRLTMMEITHPDDLPLNLKHFERLVERGQCYIHEKRYLKPDGESVWVLVSVAMMGNRNDASSQIVAVCQNITDRKWAERILRQRTVELAMSNRKVGLILESLPQIAWTTATDGGYTYLNRNWYQYTGHPTGKDVPSNPPALYLHPDDLSDMAERWLHCLQQNETFEAEYRIRRQDGEFRWHLGRALPLRNREGMVTQWVGTCTDVHDLKLSQRAQQALSEELTAMNEELTAANEEISTNNDELNQVNQHLVRINADLDTFVYAASHDLKSPITSLEALLMFLRKQIDVKLTGKEQELFTLIEACTARLQKTIRELTQIARIQRDTQEEKERITFEEIYQEVKADLEPQIQEAGAQLIPSFGVAQMEYVPKNLRSILYNLLSNAIKYRSPERPPVIRISTYLQESQVVLAVQDNGLGLTAGQINHLFTLFKRLHTHVDGSGVGLYMIRRIVENSGGRIEVESQPGEGTTFRVHF